MPPLFCPLSSLGFPIFSVCYPFISLIYNFNSYFVLAIIFILCNYLQMC